MCMCQTSYCIVVLSYPVDYRQSLNVAAIIQIINPLNNTIPDDIIAIFQY